MDLFYPFYSAGEFKHYDKFIYFMTGRVIHFTLIQGKHIPLNYLVSLSSGTECI